MFLAENKTLRMLTLCGFYIAQGLPWGFVTVAMKAWLAGEPHHMGEAQIGDLVAYAAFPWSFKWIWGFVVDGYQTSPMGKRRPWLILAQVIMLFALGSLLLVTDIEANFELVLQIILVANIFVGLQDVSVDAMAVDLLTDEDRERVSGFMYGASYLGTAIGGAGLGWVIAKYGIQQAMICQCLLLAVSLLLPIFVRERRGDKFFGFKHDQDQKNRQASLRFVRLGKDLFQAFSLRSTLIGAFVALTVKIGYGMISPKFTVFLRTTAEWSIEKYTEVEGLWGSLAGFTACILGALAAQKFGAKPIAAFGLIALSIMWITVGMQPDLLGNDTAAAWVIVLQESFLGLVTVGLFAIYCAISSPKVAAIQFTAYMAILNFSYSLGSKLSGFVSGDGKSLWSPQLSLQQLFVLGASIQAILVLAVWMIDLTETRRVVAQNDEVTDD